MRRLLFTALCVCLLSTAAFAQTSPSSGGLVVFETFGFGVGTAATQAGVLPGKVTTQIVLFATASARLSRNLGVAIVNPGSTPTNVTMTLRRGGDTAPAPVPQVVPGVGGADAVILPQFAAGGGWSSEIVISNTTAIPTTVRIDLFKSDSAPLTTNLSGQSGSSFQNLTIAPGGNIMFSPRNATGDSEF